MLNQSPNAPLKIEHLVLLKVIIWAFQTKRDPFDQDFHLLMSYFQKLKYGKNRLLF